MAIKPKYRDRAAAGGERGDCVFEPAFDDFIVACVGSTHGFMGRDLVSGTVVVFADLGRPVDGCWPVDRLCVGQTFKAIEQHGMVTWRGYRHRSAHTTSPRSTFNEISWHMT